jgi:hypothetical protein
MERSGPFDVTSLVFKLLLGCTEVENKLSTFLWNREKVLPLSLGN